MSDGSAGDKVLPRLIVSPERGHDTGRNSAQADGGCMIESSEERILEQKLPGVDGQGGQVVSTHSVEHTSRLTGLGFLERFVQIVLGTMTTFILFRFLLLMIGVNRQNGFAEWLLGVTHPLVAPFLSLFGHNPAVDGSVLELTDLVAIAVYLLAGMFFMNVARLATGRARSV
jgi:uncharacterized protein YggT (Ycf19 family)